MFILIISNATVFNYRMMNQFDYESFPLSYLMVRLSYFVAFVIIVTIVVAASFASLNY